MNDEGLSVVTHEAEHQVEPVDLGIDFFGESLEVKELNIPNAMLLARGQGTTILDVVRAVQSKLKLSHIVAEPKPPGAVKQVPEELWDAVKHPANILVADREINMGSLKSGVGCG